MTLGASLPYTCGELFQGALDGEPCLVSCPIAVYSTAEIGRRSTIASLPRKARLALDALGATGLGPTPITLIQRLPPGRGFGTSTADIGAALYAAAWALKRDLSAGEAARMAVAIEPSDSTFFPGLSLFAHRSGQRELSLGAPPPARIVVLDPGGMVDTESFNALDWRAALRAIAAEHHEAFSLLHLGVGRGDLATIGAAATLSARAHQALLPSLWLEPALVLARELGAVGVCRAHSGTVLGLIFAPEPFDRDRILARVRETFPALVRAWTTGLIGGGVRLAEPEAQLVGVGAA